MSSLHRICLLALLGAGIARAEEALTLPQVLAEVSRANPQVLSARALASAEEEKITQEAAWEDPIFGIASMRSGTLSPTNYSALEFSFSQKLPVTATRRRRVALAKAQAAAAGKDIGAQNTPLIIAATDAFYRLAQAREQRELTRRSDEILQRAVEAVRSRLADGGASVAGVLLAETEQARLQEEFIAFDRECADAITELNRLRNLPAETLVGPIDATVSSAESSLPSFETLRDRALARRTEVQAAEARVTAADRATEVSQSWLPDPTVSVFARHLRGRNDPVNEYDAEVAIALPWLHRGKYRAAVREAQHRREAAELDAAALRSRTAAELREAWNAWQSADRSMKLYSERLVPLAERALDAARTGIDSGRSGMLELIAAEKNLREVRNGLANARAERARKFGLLRAMSGENLLPPS
jgi:cobalt-zinc-cadmium efflux system outer membrane protein